MVAMDKCVYNMNESDDRPFIFVSISGKDFDRVQPFIEALQKKYRVWYYIEGVPIGDNWVEVIDRQLKACRFVLAIISDNALHHSKYCPNEIQTGYELNKLLAIKLDKDYTPTGWIYSTLEISKKSLNEFIMMDSAVEYLVSHSNSQFWRDVAIPEVAPRLRRRPPFKREGKWVEFGSYPQKEVRDANVIRTLNTLAGALPTADNSHNWTSYNYYIGAYVDDFMWYIDLKYQGRAYRGVYFTDYRPYKTFLDSMPSTSYQDEFGYLVDKVYWFLYEPIKWRVLFETNGEGLLLADSALDSQEYYDNDELRGSVDQPVYPTNYAESNIRYWLNNVFFNTAFSTEEKTWILDTEVDNSERSTNPYTNDRYWDEGRNRFACPNTVDRVFLLSEREVTNPEYGFDADCVVADDERKRRCTDYGVSQGCFTNLSTENAGFYSWWLRSPKLEKDPTVSNVMHGVRYGGEAEGDSFVTCTYRGIVPAIRMRLK